MDKDAFKTRVTNSQLTGLHIAAAVFVVIGIGAEIAVGHPATRGGDLAETFDSPLTDPAWIIMQEVPDGELADCFSTLQVEQAEGDLRITARHVKDCDGSKDGRMVAAGTRPESNSVASGLVKAGFPLPRFGHLQAIFTPPPGVGTEPFIALTHPDGIGSAVVSLSGSQVTVQLDGAVRAQTTLPTTAEGAARALGVQITNTDDGVRFQLSIDGEVILDHTESVALDWTSTTDPAAAWILQLALGADTSAELPQTLSIDSISYIGIND